VQTKLTLSVTPSVVSRAKRYAKQQGISVSQMVEVYLSSVTKPVGQVQDHPPVLRSLVGSLKKADPKDYRRHLVKKHL
jgi:hypothetical protein